MILTFRYRIKDANSAKYLDRHARAVNYVWNYCCEVQRHAQAWRKKWPSHFDLVRLTAGASAELHLHSDSISEICRHFAKSRAAKRRCPRWRGRKSLPWVPLRPKGFQIHGDAVTYLGRRYRLWLSRPPLGIVKASTFSSDTRGRWYINLCCEVEQVETSGCGSVGIDLGLKTLATLSDGSAIDNPRHMERHAKRLAIAQRARNKRRVAAINAKIGSCRRDHLHKETTRLANTYQRIVVGDVSASSLARTKMAKSVNDAGWTILKEMLRYKLAIRRGAEYIEVSERYSTVTCSACGARGGPKGQKGLRIREWICSACGVVHDRDLNAARNILGAGRRPLVEGMAA